MVRLRSVSKAALGVGFGVRGAGWAGLRQPAPQHFEALQPESLNPYRTSDHV